MNISSTSASSNAASLWSLLASRAASSTSRTAASGSSSDTSTSSTEASSSTSPPKGPPPPPSQFDCGQMSTAQFAGMGGGQPPSLSDMDSDGDGSISADEYGLDSADDMATELFSKVDSDGDGSLSGDEVSAFEEMMASQAQQGGPGGPGGMPPPPPTGEDPIASLDADDSGSVSAEEFGLDSATDEVQTLFAAIDSDSSGDLSTDEIDGFREQMMAADGGSRPMGPPPGATGASSSGSSGSVDVSAFLQQLAERYASVASSDSNSTTLELTA